MALTYITFGIVNACGGSHGRITSTHLLLWADKYEILQRNI